MGGAVSSGLNNDDLIDNLLEADYIKSSTIERVFRAVDRAEYFLPEVRSNAYKDLAWKNGNLHLSAPCIYSKVMEGLCLQPGLSFLNLGSGTGYLSTMVGLILGSNGINHGIEIYKDVIQYAYKKLEDFKRCSGAIDEYDFCEPKFIQGNCLCLTSDFTLYDRVYCGAACPEQYESYMKNLLKVGGILVMPLNEQLVQIKKISDNMWDVRTLLPVSFASLIVPIEEHETVQMIGIDPLPLQSLCRSVIRNILRKNVEFEHPPAKRIAPVTKAPKRKRVLKRLVVPLFESDDSSDDDRRVRLGGERNLDAGRASFRGESDGLINFFLGSIRDKRNMFSGERQHESMDDRSDRNNTEAMETDTTNESTDDNERQSNNETQVEAVIEHNPASPSLPENPANQEDFLNTMHEIHEVFDAFDDVLNVLRRERVEDESVNDENETSDEQDARQTKSEAGAGPETKKKGKREKFDSGLGDEIVETRTDSSENEDNDMKLEVISSSDEEDQAEKQNKRPSSKPKRESRPGLKLRRIEVTHRFMSDSSSDNDRDDETKLSSAMRMYASPYSQYMKAKIQELPLPPILKRYLNFYREF